MKTLKIKNFITSFLLIASFVLAPLFSPVQVQAAGNYHVPQIWHIGSSLATGNYIGAVTGQGFSTTEAYVQFRVTKAGTFSGLTGFVSTANGSGTSTLKFRINGADGNQTINWTSGQSGRKSDTTNSDTVAVGDLVSISLTTTAGSITLASVTNLFQATSGDTVQFLMATGNETFGSNSLTRYYRPVGELEILNSEPIRQNYIMQAATASDLAVYVSANTRTGTTTFRLRKNTANGNEVIAVTTLVTGLVRDSSNTDSIAADNLIAHSMTTGGGSGSITTVNMQVTLTSTDPKQITLLGGVDRIRSSGAGASYYMIAGSVGTGGVENGNKSVVGVDATITKFSVRTTSNGSNRDMIVTFRKNTANGNQTVTVTAGANSWATDSTNNDVVDSNDELAFSIVPTSAGTGNVTWPEVSMLATFPDNTPSFIPQVDIF